MTFAIVAIIGSYAIGVLCWLFAFGLNGAPDFLPALKVALRWPQQFWNWTAWNDDALALHGYGPKAGK